MLVMYRFEPGVTGDICFGERVAETRDVQTQELISHDILCRLCYGRRKFEGKTRTVKGFIRGISDEILTTEGFMPYRGEPLIKNDTVYYVSRHRVRYGLVDLPNAGYGCFTMLGEPRDRCFRKEQILAISYTSGEFGIARFKGPSAILHYEQRGLEEFDGRAIISGSRTLVKWTKEGFKEIWLDANFHTAYKAPLFMSSR